MAERVIKISKILCEIFDRTLFVKHSIISVLITQNGVTEVIPQIGSIIYMLNNNRPKIEPWETPKCTSNDFLSSIWMYWRGSHYSHVGSLSSNIEKIKWETQFKHLLDNNRVQYSVKCFLVISQYQVISSLMHNSTVAVECPLQNPAIVCFKDWLNLV